jgi:hypothetical protein
VQILTPEELRASGEDTRRASPEPLGGVGVHARDACERLNLSLPKPIDTAAPALYLTKPLLRATRESG